MWSGNATIGFNAGGSQFENHPFSGTFNTKSIACINYNNTVWTNLIYKLTPNGKTIISQQFKWLCDNYPHILQYLHSYSSHKGIITSKD